MRFIELIEVLQYEKIFNFSLVALLMGLISACTQSPPKCPDEETLNLVRGLFFDVSFYTKKELETNVVFEKFIGDGRK